MLVRKKSSINVKNRMILNDKTGAFTNFIKTLENTNFNTQTFYNNMCDIKFEETHRFTQDKTALALYDLLSNKIQYLKDYYKYAIMHELFHMASTVLDGDFLYSGFFQKDLKSGENIGIALTEAYSMILDKRYFPDYVSDKMDVIANDYSITSYFVSMIEEIIGKSTMEKMYSENNLYDLMNILIPFTSKKETFRFVRALDYITLHFENVDPLIVSNRVLREISYANSYICKLMIYYAKSLRKDEIITNEEYSVLIEDIAKQFSTPIVIGKHFKRKTKAVAKKLIFRAAK